MEDTKSDLIEKIRKTQADINAVIGKFEEEWAEEKEEEVDDDIHSEEDLNEIITDLFTALDSLDTTDTVRFRAIAAIMLDYARELKMDSHIVGYLIRQVRDECEGI